METKMRFDCVNVKSHLQRFGLVFTVRGYDMKNKIVMVDDVGQCKRTQIKEIKRITDLSDYVSRSGFLRVLSWWLQIDSFTADKRKFLYKVEKIGAEEHERERQESYLHYCGTAAAEQVEAEKEEKEAGDLIESMILDAWKREGGIHKRAAEEYEKEGDLYKQAVAELEEELDG